MTKACSPPSGPTSPFSGEGHRKVWARLHYGLGLPVGRNRVLRLMRDNQLLSPFRPRPANDHDGTILTEAPDVLWGTDATLVQTVEEGRVWVFAAIDHFNSEVVGHYVSTDGSRSAALEPISQAVTSRFGGIAADAARGVSLRLDNGPQYTSHHFSRQISHWGMALSYAFPHQPQCNGVITRLAAAHRAGQAGPRDSGLCLTGPSTVASFLQVGSPQPRSTTP
jgi:putative transposase